jgi:hypothetical protein
MSGLTSSVTCWKNARGCLHFGSAMLMRSLTVDILRRRTVHSVYSSIDSGGSICGHHQFHNGSMLEEVVA